MLYIPKGSKLAIHAQKNTPNLMEHVGRAADLGAPFALVKTTQEHTRLKTVKQRRPQTITLARAVARHDGMQGVVDAETDAQIEWWANEVLKPLYEFALYNPDFQEYIDIWEFINEADPVGDKGHYNLGRVMARCVEKASADFPSMRWGIGSFNMGCPEYSEMQAFADSGVFEYGNVILCLHEGVPEPDDPVNKWHSTGPRPEPDEHPEIPSGLIPGAPSVPEHGGALYGRVAYWHQILGDDHMPPVVISEAYLHAYGNNAEVRQRAKWVDELYSNLWYVIGWAPFTHSPEANWTHQDYTPAYDGLIDYMAEVAGRQNALPPVKEEDPMPDTGLNYKSIVILLPQTATLDQILQVRREEYANRRTITQSLDEALRLRQLGEEGSYIIACDIENWNETEQALILAGPHKLRRLTPEPNDMFLAVEPLSQRDPRWRHVILGQNTGHGVTIGGWGCLMVAYNVMARFLGLTNDLPPEFQKRLVATGGMTAQFTNNHALAKAYPDQIVSFGWKTRNDPTMHADIRHHIEAGIPVPARVDFVPATPPQEQHWVLLIGILPGDDYYIADPWTGDIGKLSDIYPIAGSDVLEACYYGWQGKVDGGTQEPPANAIDLLPYLRGDGRMYEVRHHTGPNAGAQETFQTQYGDDNVFFQVKNHQWEEFAFDDQYIYRGRDTSPGPAPDYAERPGALRWYRQWEEGKSFARWCKRHMRIGETFTGPGHQVQFYYKSDCSPSAANSGPSTNIVTLVARHDRIVWNGREYRDVIELKTNTGESMYFPRNYGLGGWSASWGGSAISEEHAPGSRQPLNRESGCFA